MAKAESVFCAATWTLMNLLIVLVAIEPLSLGGRTADAPVVHLETQPAKLTV